MGYPDQSNPRHVRAMIDNVYAGYVRGQDLFPRARLQRSYEDLPRKTQPIAESLERAWSIIDEDRAYFLRAVGAAIERVKADKEERSALVITCIGLNAVNLAQVNGPQLKVAISHWSKDEFVDRFEGHEFALTNGEAVTLHDGSFEGPIKGVVVRRSNMSGVFGGGSDAIRALVGAAGNTPLQTLEVDSL